MNDVDRRPRRGAWQADQRPAEIGGRVQRLRDVADARGQRPGIGAAEGNDLEPRAERQQLVRERGGVPADARRR
jgi:hypothetical protein